MAWADSLLTDKARQSLDHGYQSINDWCKLSTMDDVETFIRPVHMIGS